MTLFSGNLVVRAALDAALALIDNGASNGTLRIYSGSVPADADAALGGATLLAQLDMSDPAFPASSDDNPGATSTANAISDDTAADATGTAAFFRILDSDLVVRFQGAVTATGGGGELELNTVSIVASAVVSVTSLVATLPES